MLTQHIQIVHVSFTQSFNGFSHLHVRKTLTGYEDIFSLGSQNMEAVFCQMAPLWSLS